MDTQEMRLLTVPQFARRVSRSEDEILAMIAARDVKALRPDPEGGYRVLETEVDRILQVHTTRIKPNPTPAFLGESDGGRVSKTVPLELHLATVTSLESERKSNSRLERLNSGLQSELFQYQRLLDDSNKELNEVRVRMRASHERLLELEKEKIQKPQQRSWWARLFS